MYDVIYADPPWAYRNMRTGGNHRSGSAQHYATLTVAEICALPVSSIVSSPATLWLWATMPLFPEIEPVMRGWGFQYKTALVWRKSGRKPIGHWFRNEAELLLLGIRGRVPAFRSSLHNVIEALWEGHSAKPAIFRELIERYTPNQRRLELFARRPSDAEWTCTGFESDGRDVRDFLTEIPQTPKVPKSAVQLARVESVNC
jgi:N6-adenosine-specific RNA methylase IME4